MKTSIFSETWGIVTLFGYTKQSGLRLSGTSKEFNDYSAWIQFVDSLWMADRYKDEQLQLRSFDGKGMWQTLFL